MSRDAIVAVLRAENVLVRRCFCPGCHRMKPFSAMHEYASVGLLVTDNIAARVDAILRLPPARRRASPKLDSARGLTRRRRV